MRNQISIRYRPQTFEQIVEQEFPVKVLRGSIDRNRLSSSYLFAGPRGSGKTSLARILAKAINCEKGLSSSPCGECKSCTAIESGSSLDYIEIDAASKGGIEDARELIPQSRLSSIGRYRVFVLDEAHMLTTPAQNALLKILEEPPESVIFILASTEPDKLLPTLSSRCLRLYFKSLSSSVAVEFLEYICQQEEIEYEVPALELIVSFYNGALRDIQTFLEAFVASGQPILKSEIDKALGVPSPYQIWKLVKTIEIDTSYSLISECRSLVENYYVSDILSSLLSFYKDVLFVCKGLSDFVSFIDSAILSELSQYQISLNILRVRSIINRIHSLNLKRFSDRQKQIAFEVFLLGLHDTRESDYTTTSSSDFDFHSVLKLVSNSIAFLRLEQSITSATKEGKIKTDNVDLVRKYENQLIQAYNQAGYEISELIIEES